MRYFTVETYVSRSISNCPTYRTYQIAAKTEKKMIAIMNLIMDKGESVTDYYEETRISRNAQLSFERNTVGLLKRYTERTFGRCV